MREFIPDPEKIPLTEENILRVLRTRDVDGGQEFLVDVGDIAGWFAEHGEALVEALRLPEQHQLEQRRLKEARGTFQENMVESQARRNR